STLSIDSNRHVAPSGDFRMTPRPGAPTVILPADTNAPGTCTVSALLPSTRVLLAETIAPEPSAVATVRVVAPKFADAPMAVLLFPVVLRSPAKSPKNALLAPDWFRCPEKIPKNALLSPVLLACPDPFP